MNIIKSVKAVVRKYEESLFEKKVLYKTVPWWRGDYWLYNAGGEVRMFIRRIYLPIAYRIVPKHRYHVVRCLPTPGYADADTRMLGAIMQLVEEFEQERVAFIKVMGTTEGEYRHDCPEQEEIDMILHWWRTHPENTDKMYAALSEPNATGDCISNHYNEETEMMVRAVNIRSKLWI